MKITPKIDFVSGDFDTITGKLVCVPYHKHGEVLLCISDGEKTSWNIPIAKIKLYSSGLFKDFDATYKGASVLGREIARRFNEFPQDRKK